MNNASYGRLTRGLIAAWFAFALLASALHLFKTALNGLPLALGIAALTPVAVFLLWFAASAKFRMFALSLDARMLTLTQSWRTAGFTFLVLYSSGILPGIFALPAGFGDIAVGATAAMAAMKLANFSSRRGFIVWQILGMFDLVLAVTLGTTAGLIEPHGVGTAVMTVLPMSVIPTFAVPLLFILHVICIAQARRWKGPQDSPSGPLFPSAAINGSRADALQEG